MEHLRHPAGQRGAPSLKIARSIRSERHSYGLRSKAYVMCVGEDEIQSFVPRLAFLRVCA